MQQKKETGQSGALINTPYDDVYRTMLNDCSSMIIPVINETFGEHFSGDEEIIFSPNEHYINRQDGEEDKRITDASFTVIGIEAKRYLMECQSTADSSMLIRIFEYATQIALDDGELAGDTLKVEIPNCAVLFLRSTKNTPDKMYIEITAPKGSLTIDVQVIRAQKYTLDEIFEKNLLFLIPFYIFSHEKRFSEYDTDGGKLESLKAEYVTIMDRLDSLQKAGQLSAYYRKIIIEMSGRVLEHLAAKYENVKEGVKSIMGGRVLDYEAKTIYTEGLQKGEEKLKKAQKETVLNLYAMGMEESQIAKAVNVSLTKVREWLGLTPAL